MKEKFYRTKKFNKIIKISIDQILDCSAIFGQKKDLFSNYATSYVLSNLSSAL